MKIEFLIVALTISVCQAVDLGIDIPDIAGSKSGVDWSAKNIILADVSDDGYTVGPDENDKYIRVKISKITVKASADIAYKYGMWGVTALSDSTSADVFASAKSVSVDVDFGFKNQKPYFKVMQCNLKLDKINVTFKSGQSWIYNLFVTMLKSYVKSPIEKALCDYFSTLAV